MMYIGETSTWMYRQIIHVVRLLAYFFNECIYETDGEFVFFSMSRQIINYLSAFLFKHHKHRKRYSFDTISCKQYIH